MRPWFVLMILAATACARAPAPRAVTRRPSSTPWLLNVRYAAHSPFDIMTLGVKGAIVEIAVSRQDRTVPLPVIHQWVYSAVWATENYFGEFPVPRVRVVVLGNKNPVAIHQGMTFGGTLIRVALGSQTNEDIFKNDWVMTHEMFHLGFPVMDDPQRWMMEGLSTYLEPVARVRSKLMSEKKMWSDMMISLPNGLPQKDDRGLNETPTWGRTYWGGCLFWFLADIEIRKETQGSKSLDDAIRAIVQAGGNHNAFWTVERVLRVADRATATHVASNLYERMAKTSWAPDIDALWSDLGIHNYEGAIVLDDDAPLAWIRNAITLPNTIGPTNTIAWLTPKFQID